MCGTPVGVDNTSRRKFDKEEYLERARQREQREKDEAWKGKERGPPVQRQPLKHRDYEVDLDSRLGKTQIRERWACLCVLKGHHLNRFRKGLRHLRKGRTQAPLLNKEHFYQNKASDCVGGDEKPEAAAADTKRETRRRRGRRQASASTGRRCSCPRTWTWIRSARR
ncbi:uncharacterized protein [Miscanthus floridulus]|uniref:uncharacterized protein isoform X2 n=1 Tax=Miscanthus floridulus TaxID=154761 RepID=UPI00345A6C88